MKTMYKCEKCGKMSDNYDEISRCEQMHYYVHRGWDVDEITDTLENMSEYKEWQDEPNVIHVLLKRSYWDGDEWKEEKRCGKYKLIASYEAPLVIKDE